MRKLRLIKPWRLQTRRQRTGFDHLEMRFGTAEAIPCRGPQENALLEEREVSNPRASTITCCRVAGPEVKGECPRMECGPRG